jgi:hypothetical protein
VNLPCAPDWHELKAPAGAAAAAQGGRDGRRTLPPVCAAWPGLLAHPRAGCCCCAACCLWAPHMQPCAAFEGVRPPANDVLNLVARPPSSHSHPCGCPLQTRAAPSGSSFGVNRPLLAGATPLGPHPAGVTPAAAGTQTRGAGPGGSLRQIPAADQRVACLSRRPGLQLEIVHRALNRLPSFFGRHSMQTRLRARGVATPCHGCSWGARRTPGAAVSAARPPRAFCLCVACATRCLHHPPAVWGRGCPGPVQGTGAIDLGTPRQKM